jgi:acyl-CoA reductase-like NAD-dependent aldehyde dehydrogenase
MQADIGRALGAQTVDGLARASMLIGSEWSPPDGADAIAVSNPATQEVIALVPRASDDDVDRAVRAASAALPAWRAMAAAERGRLLTRLADALEAEAGKIAMIESRDNGRPIRETAAQSLTVPKWYRYFGGMADKIEGVTLPVEGPYLNYVKRVPVGVCAALTPWNHPTLIAAKKVAPALACGNTMVLKPSELAPLAVLELGRLALEAGIPPGVLNIVTGERDTGSALVRHPDVARIDLTGSTPTAVTIAQAAAPQMKRLGFELGGKAANLVFADANLERSAAGAVWSAYVAQGQTCVCGSRVLVEESVADEFLALMIERLRRIRLGDPTSPETQMGPVITPAARQRIAGTVADACSAGAGLLIGGGIPSDLPAHLSPDGYYEPTLLATTDPGSPIAQEEIFGPVVTVMRFRDEEEAVAIANGTPFGLAAGVWTSDVSRAHRVADKLNAGIVYVNDYHRVDPASPWGGFGLSGYGRENGFFAVEMFTEPKSVWVPTEDRPLDWYESSRPARLN